FSLTYSICCLAKLSRDYLVLVVGRVLGGLSTALLFSAFEAWYVHEHVERYDFPTEWIAVTFSRAAFWNNVIAVGAGGVADFFAEWLGLGPVAPFMVSIPLLVLSGVFAVKNWDENYGKKRAFSKTCGDGLKCLLSDRRVLLLGTIQALFESVIYIFIFLWTPVLDPHGSFLAFLLIELSCGLYFPAMGFLRRKVVPEKDRLGVMNWFRLPLNLLACLGLLVLHDSDRRTG
ncbi:PREDICTED: molybdate-anion transporter, partial [Fulmarus glacialis]|uniref:molybdate-anion transporter n=1 Tax=Fulmarus glacialis TaxID=30455 RepID=UPI00051B608F